MTEIGLFATNLSHTAPSIGGLLEDKIEEGLSYTISPHLYTTGRHNRADNKTRITDDAPETMCNKRSIDMTSDSGLTSQDTDYAKHIQEALNELQQMQQTPRLVTSPDELEALEREIRQRTDQLGQLIGRASPAAGLDSAALQAEQEQLVRQWPKPLKNDGKVKVRVRTAQGYTVPVWVTYYRRKGQRRAGKRDAGVYAGLVLLGIYDRCTPALAAEVSLLAAMLGSLDEAQAVLADRGVALDTKTVRLIAYRYAARARLVQQVDQAAFEDTVAGRRVVISSDGGRLRLRETKRGPRPKKGADAIRGHGVNPRC